MRMPAVAASNSAITVITPSASTDSGTSDPTGATRRVST